MNKTILIALFGIVSICRVSFGDDNPTNNNPANQPKVELKFHTLTLPVKVAEDTGNNWMSNQTQYFGTCVGVFPKKAMDIVLWKSLKQHKEVLLEDFATITVKSGQSETTQKGYEFSYPIEYDATAKPIKMNTHFLGTKLEVKPIVSNGSIDLSFKFERRNLKEITQVYSVNESDLMKKPSLAELVSALPKNTVFNPVFENCSFDGSVRIYKEQTIFYSMDEYENAALFGKVPLQQMKRKDPSKRHFLIITAKVINSPNS
jgi:hypothetical protein